LSPLGGDGAVVYGPNGEGRLAMASAAEVAVVDTTGAGDAFCGVLADRLARGFDVVAAVRDASRLAGLSTTVQGAQVPASFPSLADDRVSPGNRPLPEALGPRR
jgi:ribokinase